MAIYGHVRKNKVRHMTGAKRPGRKFVLRFLPFAHKTAPAFFDRGWDTIVTVGFYLIATGDLLRDKDRVCMAMSEGYDQPNFCFLYHATVPRFGPCSNIGSGVKSR